MFSYFQTSPTFADELERFLIKLEANFNQTISDLEVLEKSRISDQVDLIQSRKSDQVDLKQSRISDPNDLEQSRSQKTRARRKKRVEFYSRAILFLGSIIIQHVERVFGLENLKSRMEQFWDENFQAYPVDKQLEPGNIKEK